MEKRYVNDDFKHLWSLNNKYAVWLKVEYAVYEAMINLRKIEDENFSYLQKIKSSIEITDSVVEKIDEIEGETKHDVVAFLKWFEYETNEKSRFFHYGMTSSDLVDTSTAIILRDAIDIILNDIDCLTKSLSKRAIDSGDIKIMGRTHGVYAQPINLSTFFSGYISELKRARASVLNARETISYGKISGPVGSYTNIDPQVEVYTLYNLGLKAEPLATQVIPRDRYSDVIYSLAKCASVCERLATNIRLYHRSEVNEIIEDFSRHQKGSSSMPHKRNPISCENICGISRAIRSFVAPSLENNILWHERDISHSSSERIILKQSTSYTSYTLRKMKNVIDDLFINEEQIINRLEKSGSLGDSEAFMLRLISKGYSRSCAHSTIQECYKHAVDGDINKFLIDNNILSKDEVNECTKKKDFGKQMMDRVLK